MANKNVLWRIVYDDTLNTVVDRVTNIFGDGVIHFDTTVSNTNTTFPNGTNLYPVSSFVAVGIIIGLTGIRKVVCHALGNYNLDQLLQCDFHSADNRNAYDNRIIFTYTQNQARFFDLAIGNSLSTAYSIGYCDFIRCLITQSMTSSNGTVGPVYGCNFVDCFVENGIEIKLAADGLYKTNYFKNCDFKGVTLNFRDDADSIAYIEGCRGILTIKNLTVEKTIYVHGFSGSIIIDASCTAGTIVIMGGKGQVTNGGTSTVTKNGFYPDSAISGMALDSTVAKDSTVSKPGTAQTITAPADMALNSTVAKEATLNTKIPTALSFTGANVNAESKVTAVPSDMALNSTVAKDATVSKPGTAQTITAPEDMALNSTVAKAAILGVPSAGTVASQVEAAGSAASAAAGYAQTASQQAGYAHTDAHDIRITDVPAIKANPVVIGSVAQTPVKLLDDLKKIMDGIDDLLTGDIE